MNILVVTSMYPTREDPGLGAFVASQVESIRRFGHTVDVLFLDARRAKWELVKGIPETRSLAASGRYDLIHAHFGYNGLPACLQRKLPVVVSFCGTDLMRPALRPISRWVARRADACIVKSTQLREVLGVRAHVIPNAVDLERFRPEPKHGVRRRLGLHPTMRYALFAADPDRPEKRYDRARQALEFARRFGVDLDPLVLHRRPHEEVPLYMNAADVLLLTSDYEGSPNVVKEAMACNLPVVSTDVGDVRTVLGRTRNCAVSASSPDALGRGILAVLQDGGRSDGRTRIAHLASDAIAERIVGIYRRVLQQREGRP
jgi:glycosyltransferase involved in cell wall biosynthesis